MTQDQILRTRRSADRVYLYEAESFDGGEQFGRFEKRSTDRIGAQLVETDRHISGSGNPFDALRPRCAW
jgi:hypothetical protein